MSDPKASHKYDIFGQIFYPDGTRNGSQFKINGINDEQQNQSFPFVIGTIKPNSGRFLVIWSSETSTPGEYNIRGQIYDADLPEENRKIMLAIYYPLFGGYFEWEYKSNLSTTSRL